MPLEGSENVLESLPQEVLGELSCKTVFKIGNIPFKESVVVTWVIMLSVVLLCALLVRNFKVNNPSKRQLFFECAVTKLRGLIADMLGEEASGYAEYLCCVIIYIAIANIAGIFGFKPPTKDINVTAGLAIMSIIIIEYAAIHKKGVKKWMKSFAQPMAVIAPINILELVIRPLSLCMRLFGNVVGAFVIMKLIEKLLPVGLPVLFGLYFDIFDGLIQAYVFVFLTSLFIKEAVE